MNGVEYMEPKLGYFKRCLKNSSMHCVHAILLVGLVHCSMHISASPYSLKNLKYQKVDSKGLERCSSLSTYAISLLFFLYHYITNIYVYNLITFISQIKRNSL